MSETNDGDARYQAEIEQALTEALERRLPQYPASHALKRRLAAEWAAAAATEPPRAEPARRLRPRYAAPLPRLVLPALAAVLVFAVLVSLWSGGRRTNPTALVAEAVNDHLRVVALDHRLPVESSDTHQVKPWFTGRIDFAPEVAFGGDEEFPLKGGTIEHFLDRRAAVFVFGRHRHTASLLVVRADGLQWPASGTTTLAGHPAAVRTLRGFHVVVWRQADLGYLLVSDLETSELLKLASRIAGGA